MAITETTNLGLKKAVPGTSELYSTARNNENYDKIDLHAGTVLSSVSALQTAVSGKADAADLAAKADASDLAAEVTAREAAESALANAGAKNLLKITKYAAGQTVTTQGRTFEFLSDGGIRITGTTPTTAYADVYLIGAWSDTDVVLDLHADSYTISVTSDAEIQNPSAVYFRAVDRRSGATAETASASLAAPEKTFSMYVTTVLLTVRPAADIPENGITVYPMIRRAAIADGTFQPYAPTNRELYEMILALEANA